MVAQIDAAYLRQRWRRLPARLIAYGAFEGRPLATKGRWINPLVFAGYRLFCAAPQLKRIEAPIFIVGVGRSGTTVMGVVLSAHPDVGFLNEPKAAWHAAHGGEDIIGSYASGPARVSLAAADATPEAGRRLARIYGGYLRLAGARRIVDKYPELVFRIGFVRALFPDAKFLFLTRRGRDAAASIDAWSERKGLRRRGEVHDWWGRDDRKWRLMAAEAPVLDAGFADRAAQLLALTDHRARAAVEWTLAMRAGMAAEAEHPGAVMRVPYERLCAEPRRTLDEICAFCGLPASEPMTGYAQTVLRPPGAGPAAQSAPELPDWIAAPFLATERALGYVEPAAGRAHAR